MAPDESKPEALRSTAASNPTPAPGVAPGMAAAPALGKALWMHNDDVDTCTRCLKTRFDFLHRKHHCRFCGWVVCDGCSQRKQ